MALRAHGKFPRVVYRAFSKLEYAQDFVERGRFRLGNLRVYAKSEDAQRKDYTEGTAHYRAPGMVTTVFFDRDTDAVDSEEKPGYVTTHVQLGNPTFVLCCFQEVADANFLRTKFGPYVVKITNPEQLAVDLSAFLETQPLQVAGGVEGCFVTYNKGQKLDVKPDSVASTTLSYSQKPEAFEAEMEFRYVVLIMGLPGKRFDEDYLEIDLGKSLSYAYLLDTD